ncbi:protein TolQ [Alkalilimnicola ehrlichii]|uniref:protein TolQ n=1 Tax=Alkalilimnicola ehrlichii TaxID=351052 RepID=UPI000E2F1A62|nr:protein TolQ [Alkalilimnicola ehrlichii]RFA31348.1 protein TolQ [Alkalilimnicola ehrlichii]
MSVDMSITRLILDASIVVQLVMLVLLLASVTSWAVIFAKRNALQKAGQGADQFEDRFWSGGNLAEIYAQGEQSDEQGGGMERIFRAGFKEFTRARKQPGIAPEAMIEASQRAMRVSLSRELDGQEQQLPFLATVGSVSPYIGLFGTVWGIMNSFLALGQMQQATLATVAPGIAEALIATALGLFAAIPAVIAYNYYANRIERLGNRYDLFIEEFTGILHRHSQNSPSGNEN